MFKFDVYKKLFNILSYFVTWKLAWGQFSLYKESKTYPCHLTE